MTSPPTAPAVWPSTRIRLARNLNQLAFPGHQTAEDTAKLLDQLTALLPLLSEKTKDNWQLIRLQELNPDQQRILIDKHLMSPVMAEKRVTMLWRTLP